MPLSRLRDLDLTRDAADFYVVNKTNFPRLLLMFFGVVCAAFGGNTGVISGADNTFSVTREAPNTFNRDTDVLKTAAMQEAEKYCQEKGKQLKVVTWSVYKPRFISGYANAKLVFKALNPGDPELASQPAPLPTADPGLAAVENDDLYTELLKLDDLRKKGILTNKEFEAQKKKALKKSR